MIFGREKISTIQIQKWFFFTLIFLHVLPIWIFRYFPSQDGVSHIYNALVLKNYGDPNNFIIRDVWKLNLTIFPNWLSHIFLWLFLHIFSPIISEKILLTIMIAGVPIAFRYFLRSIHGEIESPFVWLGLIFTENYLLYMGFYNFAISMIFFFWSFGFWWRHKNQITINRLIGLYILLILTYLSHIVSFGLVVLAISISATFTLGFDAIKTLIQKWNEPTAFDHFPQLLKFAGYILPIYFILGDYYLDSIKKHPLGHHRGMKWISDYFWGVKSIVYFTDWHIQIGKALLITIAIAIIFSIILRIIRRKLIIETDLFLIIAAVFTFMFIRAPWSYGPGGWINDRIHIYILLMIAPFLIQKMRPIFHFLFSISLIVITLLHFGKTAIDHGKLSAEIAEELSALDKIENHSTYEIRSPDWFKSPSMGKIAYVTPFVHSMALYGTAKNDIGHLANYEANYDYFPINFKNHADHKGKPDYVVAWAYPSDEKFADLTEKFEIIHETKNLKLFRRKIKPIGDLKFSQSIKFDFQPVNSDQSEGSVIVNKDLRYSAGKFGWLTRYPTLEWRSPNEIDPFARDAVFDLEDAVFRVDLPNGKYRATNYFCSGENATHEIDLFANGKQMIDRLIVPIGNEIVKKSFEIEISVRNLTMIIHTPRKRTERERRHRHWIWNGLEIEKIND